MVTSLPFLPHRHSSRIRPRWIPRVSLQAETRRRTIQESFTTRYTHPFSLSCPSWPSFRQKRNRHPVGSLGILQVFRQRLFRELRFGQCSKLLRLSQMSTPRVLPPSTPGQDEMSLRQPLGHDHVPLRKNPGRLFFRCCRRLCPFFQWVNEDPRGKDRVWLEEDKFICLFDGRLVKCTFQDVLTETPLQKGVRRTSISFQTWRCYRTISVSFWTWRDFSRMESFFMHENWVTIGRR